MAGHASLSPIEGSILDRSWHMLLKEYVVINENCLLIRDKLISAWLHNGAPRHFSSRLGVSH